VAGILASVGSEDCEGIGDPSPDQLNELTDIVDEIFELAHLATFASGLVSNPTDIARKTLDPARSRFRCSLSRTFVNLRVVVGRTSWKAWLSPSSGKNGTAYLPRAMGDPDALLAPSMRALRLIVALTLARLSRFLKAPLRPEPKHRIATRCWWTD
jgi:hypothetical protein